MMNFSIFDLLNLSLTERLIVIEDILNFNNLNESQEMAETTITEEYVFHIVSFNK